jgi:hypothetical protein
LEVNVSLAGLESLYKMCKNSLHCKLGSTWIYTSDIHAATEMRHKNHFVDMSNFYLRALTILIKQNLCIFIRANTQQTVDFNI